jgi:hypothetical protein
MAIDLNGKAVKKLRLPTATYTRSPIQFISAKTGDMNSRILQITLYDERGNVDLSKIINREGSLYVILPDKTSRVAPCEFQSGYVYCELTEAMLEQEGQLTCDIAVTGDDFILTGQTFYVSVQKTQAADEAELGDENSSIYNKIFNKE